MHPVALKNVAFNYLYPKSLCSINNKQVFNYLFVCFSSKLDGCLVTLVHNDSDVDDEEALLLWKQLCYVSHMELHVRGLSSGYCKDVHGQVSRIKPKFLV